MTKTEFKELFLKLTEYTIPFKKESYLEKYLPEGFKKDNVGNYYYVIGESDTLFTAHLDSYCETFEKVNHVILDDTFKIGTDGTTILGGDNKLGCSILISMIKNNKQGTYYFFVGEEPYSGGLYGSKKALKNNPKFFKKFKRAIAFNRRRYGSIVSSQMGDVCCSKEFVKNLSEHFINYGLTYDETGGIGSYTDTATFMGIIPECTNISAGGFNEHYTDEWVDLNYTYKVFEFAMELNWDKL